MKRIKRPETCYSPHCQDGVNHPLHCACECETGHKWTIEQYRKWQTQPIETGKGGL